MIEHVADMCICTSVGETRNVYQTLLHEFVQEGCMGGKMNIGKLDCDWTDLIQSRYL
jgi:hypothetical protein